MHVRMVMNDHETYRDIDVSQGQIEYLGDVAEVFLTFLHACGYSYVQQVSIVKDDGSEVLTQL